MVGEKIRTLRKQKGWTQDELAKKMGYKGKASISRIEKGETDINQSTLSKFAELFGVQETYFFEFERDYSKNNYLYELSKQLTPEQLDAIIKIMEGMI